jgi:RNA polymerase-binding transcription factor DksA
MADPTNDSSREPIPTQWRQYYDQLVRQRDELIDAVEDLTVAAREAGSDPVQDGLAETGTDSNQRDQALGKLALDNAALSDIDLALSKMENGTYGICEATGEPIPEERLRAIPWARFTVEAQRAREEQSDGPK